MTNQPAIPTNQQLAISGLIQDTVQPACKVNKLNSSYPSKSYFFGGQEMHLHLSPMFVALSVTCELDMRSTKFK